MKSFRFSGRAAVVCSLILAIGVPSVAMGFGEGRNLLLGKRNPSNNPASRSTPRPRSSPTPRRTAPASPTRRTATAAARSTAAARASATSPASAPPTSRAAARSSSPRSAPKAAASRSAAPTGAPFTTNATGVATGLNADQVDGKEAADFAPATDVTALARACSTPRSPAADAPPAPTSRGAVSATTGARNDDVYTVKFNKRREQVLVHGLAGRLAPSPERDRRRRPTAERRRQRHRRHRRRPPARSTFR